MKNNLLVHYLLKALDEGVCTVADIAVVIPSTHYGANMNKIDVAFKKRVREREMRDNERKVKRRLQQYLSKLKSDGLIAFNKKDKNFSLLKKGVEKLQELENTDKRSVDLASYKREVGDKFVIVSYDIPNKYNRERALVRCILIALGFEMIHKSMWCGKVKIPKQFVIDLKNMGILEYVIIFEVTKSGTLSSVRKQSVA